MVPKLLLPGIKLICFGRKTKMQEQLITIIAQNGVYTTEQAASVASLYSTACASCHGPAGSGTDGRPSGDWKFVYSKMEKSTIDRFD